MILTEAKVRRFFSIYDPLILFTDRHLNLGELELAPDGLPTDDSQHKVACELWRNPQVIDEFVRQNPARLCARDLKIAASWKDAVFGNMPYSVRPDGSVDFIFEGRIFRPKGLTREIGGMLNDSRGTAELALLPFEDELIYAGQVSEINIAMGPGLKAAHEGWFAEAREKPAITTGTGFLAVAPGLKKAALDRETQKFIEDTEYDMNPPTSWPGFHRGALADVPHEEREALALKEARRQFGRPSGSEAWTFMKGRLQTYCLKGKATCDFATLAALEKNADLAQIAKEMGAKRTSGLKKALLVETCAELLADPAVDLDPILCELVPEHFPFIKHLVEAGGRIEIPYEGLETLEGLAEPLPLLAYWFDEGDHATCVMPDIVRERLAGRDLDALSARYKGLVDLRHVIDLLIETRGIVAVDEAGMEFGRLYPGVFGPYELVKAIIDYATGECGPCEAFRDENGSGAYLVESGLLDQVQSEGAKVYVQNGICIGELGLLQNLLDAREGKQPWPLPAELVAAPSLVDWAQDLPSGRAFLQFINENIPDGENDYLYADHIFEKVVIMFCDGVAPAKVVQWVADQGLGFEDMRHENQLIGCMFNLCNDIPRWDNNGWPPALLHSKLTGAPDFRNEDGSRKKVGRNDPCPCGSGKKYKKCCGR